MNPLICLGHRGSKEKIKAIKLDGKIYLPPYSNQFVWVDDSQSSIIIKPINVSIPKINTEDTTGQCWANDKNNIHLSTEEFSRMLNEISTKLMIQMEIKTFYTVKPYPTVCIGTRSNKESVRGINMNGKHYTPPYYNNIVWTKHSPSTIIIKPSNIIIPKIYTEDTNRCMGYPDVVQLTNDQFIDMLNILSKKMIINEKISNVLTNNYVNLFRKIGLLILLIIGCILLLLYYSK